MEEDTCQVQFVHKDRVDKARSTLPPEETMNQMVSIYKLLGDPMRLKIMLALRVGEMCVCDLANLLDATHSATSHQLKPLRLSGLVQARREGKMMFYRCGKNWNQKILSACFFYASKYGTEEDLEGEK
jgi:DNA-binding transcriptional ArsR family regulator